MASLVWFLGYTLNSWWIERLSCSWRDFERFGKHSNLITLICLMLVLINLCFRQWHFFGLFFRIPECTTCFSLQSSLHSLQVQKADTAGKHLFPEKRKPSLMSLSLMGTHPLAPSLELPCPMRLSMSTIVSTPTSLLSTCLGESSGLSPHSRQPGHSRLFIVAYTWGWFMFTGTWMMITLLKKTNAKWQVQN